VTLKITAIQRKGGVLVDRLVDINFDTSQAMHTCRCVGLLFYKTTIAELQ